MVYSPEAIFCRWLGLFGMQAKEELARKKQLKQQEEQIIRWQKEAAQREFKKTQKRFHNEYVAFAYGNQQNRRNESAIRHNRAGWMHNWFRQWHPSDDGHKSGGEFNVEHREKGEQTHAAIGGWVSGRPG